MSTSTRTGLPGDSAATSRSPTRGAACLGSLERADVRVVTLDAPLVPLRRAAPGVVDRLGAALQGDRLGRPAVAREPRDPWIDVGEAVGRGSEDPRAPRSVPDQVVP